MYPSIAAPDPLVCDLAAFASCCAPVEAIADLRCQPGPVRGEPLPANLLRHSDEQTVVSLAAVLTAIERFALAPNGFAVTFHDWGVLAAPRFVGRATVAQTVHRFRDEGSWGVSPHVIPHRSLHSVPGTLSQALKLHGPNFAVGGGPGCEAEALLAGVTLLHEMRLPGVWVVLSRLEPEGACDPATGKAVDGTQVHALALALKPITAATTTRLEITVSPPVATEAPLSPAILETLLARIDTEAEIGYPLEGVGQLVLRRVASVFAGSHAPYFACGIHRTASARERS